MLVRCVNMKTSLETGKLFRIRRTIHRTTGTAATTDDVAIRLNDETIAKARVEAEHKKAEAITILRRHTIIR